MSILILGTFKTGKTARLIAKELGADYHGSGEAVTEPYDLFFRYGNCTASLHTGVRFIMNGTGDIQESSRKPFFRQRVLRAGLSAPKLYNSWNIDKAEFPLIARPVFHYQGRNFNVVKNADEARKFLMRGYYVQEMIEKAKEFRVFVFKDKIMEVNLKVKARRNANDTIWNHRNGWIFAFVPYQNAPAEVRLLARNCAVLSGLQFCAVDIGVDTNGKAYCFEVNSAPGLIPRKVQKLCDYMRESFPEEVFKKKDEKKIFEIDVPNHPHNMPEILTRRRDGFFSSMSAEEVVEFLSHTNEPELSHTEEEFLDAE